MIVYIVAAAQALVYLLSIPVNVALRLDGLKSGSGVAAFDRGAAAHRAMAALSGGQGGGPAFRRVWPVLRRVRFDRIELTGRVSLGDAAATALLCGALNGLGRSLRGRASRMRIAVQPDFSDELHLELRGMASARSGQIMLAAFQAMKGRFHPWTSIRSRAS